MLPMKENRLPTKEEQENYLKFVAEMSPKSKIGRDMLRAFWVGGVICALGEVVNQLLTHFTNLEKEGVGSFAGVFLIFLAALLTGIGVYDKIGKYAGAGSIVPITGFANSVVAPAMEFKREGLVLGLGSKLFTLAGPVLAYGISASVLVGLIYWVFGL